MKAPNRKRVTNLAVLQSLCSANNIGVLRQTKTATACRDQKQLANGSLVLSFWISALPVVLHVRLELASASHHKRRKTPCGVCACT